MEGWIKIYRELLQWEWFGKAEMVQLFLYLLLKAGNKDKQWQGIQVKRGQLVTSNSLIRRDLGLSEQQIRTCLKRLISTGEITYQATNRYVIITICNYDRYQESKCVSNEQTNEQVNTQATSEQRAINEQSTTTKEVKNILKENPLPKGRGQKKVDEQLSSSKPEDFEASKPKVEKLPAMEIKGLWNDTCKSFPKLFTISENRKNKMRLRIAEMGGSEKAMEILKGIFVKMEESSFLKGDNRRGWKASFDWLFENDKNWVKVWEGNYDSEKPKSIVENENNQRSYSGSDAKRQRDEEFSDYIKCKLGGG